MNDFVARMVLCVWCSLKIRGRGVVFGRFFVFCFFFDWAFGWVGDDAGVRVRL